MSQAAAPHLAVKASNNASAVAMSLIVNGDPRFTGTRSMSLMALEFEYKNFRMRVTGSASWGYRIEITPREGGSLQRTMTFRDLSDTIDAAKSIVDAQVN
jgi:hypothetical protein